MTLNQEEISVRNTFLIDPEGRGNDHLWIVVLELAERSALGERRFLLVNVTSAHHHVDRACVLNPRERGQHPFIRHPSAINYRGIIAVEESRLTSYLHCRREDVSPIILQKIQNCAHRSDYIKKRWKELFPVD